MNDVHGLIESKLVVDVAEAKKYYCAYCHQAYNVNAESLLCTYCQKLLNARVALERLEIKCELSTGCTQQYVFSKLKEDCSLALEKDGDLLLEQNSSLSVKKDGDVLLEQSSSISVKKDDNLLMEQNNSLPLKKDGDHLSKKASGLSLKKQYLSLKDGSHSCVKCERSFINRRSMMKHVSNCGVKNFPCNTCGILFQDIVKLKSHESLCICLTTKPHAPSSSKAKSAKTLSCVYCEKSFNVRVTLYKHERKCRLISEAAQEFEKNRKCEEIHLPVANPHKPCSSKTEGAKMLSSEHGQKTFNLGRARGHLEFTCCSCQKIFKNKRSIVKHVAICGVKEFQCDICGEVFRKIGKLTTHEAIHIFSPDNPHEPCFSETRNVKTFSCLYCGKDFNAQITLSKHERQCKLNTEDCSKSDVKKNAVVVYLGAVDINGNDQHIWGQFMWER